MEFFKTDVGLIISMILVIILFSLVSSLVKKLMTFIYMKISVKHKTDPGRFLLFSSIIRFTIIFIGVSYAISLHPSIKSLSTSLLASAGIATAVIGFAAKDVLANFVAGFTIIIFRPFTITNWIKVGEDHEGIVEEIRLLHTVIKDITNRRMIVPNSKIVSSYVINSSYKDERIRQNVEFKIDHSSDVKKAMEIIREIAEASPLSIDNRSPDEISEHFPIVEVELRQFEYSLVVLVAWVCVNNPKDAWTIRWSLNESIKERFDQEGIKMVQSNRNLIFKNDLEINTDSKPGKE
jgi:small conductance mechanosensitive channel